MAEIEAPRQRLATSKPRSSQDSVSPHQAVADARGEELLATKRGDSDRVKATLASTDKDGTSAKLASAKRPTNDSAKRPTSNSATRTTNESDRVESLEIMKQVQKSEEELDPEAMLAAIQAFPPELRQQALRQFVAAAARSAGQTDQPNELDTELVKTIDNLPELPKPNPNESQVSPKRIAERPTDQAAMVAASGQSHGDLEASSAVAAPKAVEETASLETSDSLVSQLNESSAATASLTDLDVEDSAPTELSGDGNTNPSERLAVATASAVRGESKEQMATQAISEEVPDGDVAAAVALDDESELTPQSEQELIDQLLVRFSEGAADESEAERSSRLIKLRHMMVLAGDPDAAVAKIEGMADAEQEYLRHHLLGLWTMIDPQGHPVSSRRFTSAVPQIREAAKYAAAATDSLEVRSLAFCTEIESYGQITPFSGNRFDSGQQVILYCEVENFTAKRVDGGFETHLQASYDVFDANNTKVFSQVLPADQQVSANYLRDYFIAYQMYLPSEIQAGTYRLQLTMEDANGKKYGQSSIPFEIAK